MFRLRIEAGNPRRPSCFWWFVALNGLLRFPFKVRSYPFFCQGTQVSLGNT